MVISLTKDANSITNPVLTYSFESLVYFANTPIPHLTEYSFYIMEVHKAIQSQTKLQSKLLIVTFCIQIQIADFALWLWVCDTISVRKKNL